MHTQMVLCYRGTQMAFNFRLFSASQAVATARRDASHLTHITLRDAAATTKDVDDDSAIVARRESMVCTIGRQGSIKEDVGAAPRRKLGLGAAAGTQASENRDTHCKPGKCTHSEGRTCSIRSTADAEPFEVKKVRIPRDGQDYFSKSDDLQRSDCFLFKLAVTRCTLRVRRTWATATTVLTWYHHDDGFFLPLAWRSPDRAGPMRRLSNESVPVTRIMTGPGTSCHSQKKK